MAKSKETPDIIGSVLSGRESTKPEAEKPAAGEEAAGRSTAESEGLTKITAYLSPDDLYKIDLMLATIRRAEKSRRSRYSIVATAVALALRDFDESDPLDNELARQVMSR